MFSKLRKLSQARLSFVFLLHHLLLLLDKPDLVAARPELHWRVLASNEHVMRVVVGGVGAELFDQLVAVGHVVLHTRIPRIADGRHSHR